jgi:hypothetical protein
MTIEEEIKIYSIIYTLLVCIVSSTSNQGQSMVLGKNVEKYELFSMKLIS